jgi:hypothetical protein
MEDLRGPTHTGAGWIPLYTFLKKHRLPVEDQQRVFEVIVEIVETMMKQNFVHGDFRSANLMIHIQNEHSRDMVLDPNGRAQLRVVDFDWAGLAGTVRYPLQRTESEKWPGEDGGPISTGDDWKLVRRWWSAQFPQFNLSPYDARIGWEESVPPRSGAAN